MWCGLWLRFAAETLGSENAGAGAAILAAVRIRGTAMLTDLYR
jgi:hypothetical protein